MLRASPEMRAGHRPTRTPLRTALTKWSSIRGPIVCIEWQQINASAAVGHGINHSIIYAFLP